MKPTQTLMDRLGLSLQLLLFMGLGFMIGINAASADDDDDDQSPQVTVAALPDEGQPPAPERQLVADEPATVSTSSASPSVAEVSTTEQVEEAAENVAVEPTDPNQVRELSVEPILEKRPMLPPDRPLWVGAPNDLSERVHRLYVASFSTSTPEEAEADEALDDPLVAAVQGYLDEIFPGQGAFKLRLTPEFVRQNLLDKSTSYVAAMNTQSGTEYQKWVVLQVTPEQRAYFGEMLREHKQRERMAILGTGLAALLGLTGLSNLAFNRRRRRYPNGLTPITMTILPGGAADNAVQHVTVEPNPAVVAEAPAKKRSALSKLFILMVCGILVVGTALIGPALTVVKLEPDEARRVEVGVGFHPHRHVVEIEMDGNHRRKVVRED